MDLFRTCSQCGLKPDEVLDLSLDVVEAAIGGYSDRLLDQQIIAVQSGYWAAYYSNAKHPKSVTSITEGMMRRHNETPKGVNTVKPDVDVEAFLATEAAFQAKLNSKVGEIANG